MGSEEANTSNGPRARADRNVRRAGWVGITGAILVASFGAGTALQASSSDLPPGCTGANRTGVPLVAADGALVSEDGTTLRRATEGSAVRNLTTSGSRVAYIEDRRGPDRLVVSDRDGKIATTYAGDGELAQLAVSSRGVLVVDHHAKGATTLGLVNADGQLAREFESPVPGLQLSYPAWTGEDALVAVQEPLGSRWSGSDMARTDQSKLSVRLDEEFANQTNLWRLDLSSGRWTRLSDFSSDEDRWTNVATPTVHDDGRVSFIVTSGLGSGTSGDITFDEWQIAPGATEPTHVRNLPTDMYLAGAQSPQGDPLYVRRIGEGAQWDVGTLSDGTFDRLGCGALRVDNLDVDPDLEPSSSDVPVKEEPIDADTQKVLDSVEVTVALGPFDDRARAEAVLDQITSIGGEWRLVSGDDAPAAAAPGAWIIASVDHAQPLVSADPALAGSALAEVRAALKAGGIDVSAEIRSIPEHGR